MSPVEPGLILLSQCGCINKPSWEAGAVYLSLIIVVIIQEEY